MIIRHLVRPARSWRALSTVAAVEPSKAPTTKKRITRVRAVPKAVDADRVVAALHAFKEKHGHTVVPPNFVVPEKEPAHVDSWPAEIRGLRLGSALQLLYHTPPGQQQPPLDALCEELQFIKNLPDGVDYQQAYWQATILSAMQTYKKVHGDLYVVRSFVVPVGDATWPLPTWGVPLGHHVHTLRKKGANSGLQLAEYQRSALEQIDFPWSVMEHKWLTKFLPSLYRFHKLYGHSNVPQTFVVPIPGATATATFQEWVDLPQCHGYRLGAAVNQIRRGDAFATQIHQFEDALLQVQFPFRSFDRTWNEKILPALETYHQIHGNCSVPVYFVVPTSDPRWPPETWGTRLGFVVQNICSRGDFFPQIMRDSERLDDIGFVWNRAEVKWNRMVLPSLETFVQVYGHCEIPAHFVVPCGDPWPKAAYKLRLGRIVSLPSARRKYVNLIEIDHKRLERIGLDWSVVETGSREEDEDEEEDEEDEEDEDLEAESDTISTLRDIRRR